uniref:Fibrinogen C-terminal domain-containing protein n=1 Tax=Amphimedon queenslandica TaxID=400682 RepID=A0A1X7VGG7_AMPQE
MEPDNHEAWLVIFYRDGTDNSVNHNQPYSQYERYQGFWNVSDNHWIGSEFMHNYTQLYNTILHIELTANKIKHILLYDHLSISSKESGYRLNVGNYHGTLPNYLSHHNNNPFLTPDKDTNSYNCATLHQGGWWYNECWYVLFTGTTIEIYCGEYIFESARMSLLNEECTEC